MKNFLISVLMILVLVPCFGKRENVRVMSFNVRHTGEVADTGALHWDNRKESVVRMLKDLRPDIITLQEAHKDQYEYILSHLPMATSSGYWALPSSPRGRGSASSICRTIILFTAISW